MIWLLGTRRFQVCSRQLVGRAQRDSRCSRRSHHQRFMHSDFHSNDGTHGGRKGFQKLMTDVWEELKRRMDYNNRVRTSSFQEDMKFPSNSEVLAHHAEWRRGVRETIKAGKGFVGVGFDIGRSERSPFGPLSSSSCFEELSQLQTVDLKFLKSAMRHSAIPETKILLTVVEPAAVSITGSVTTVVKDNQGQYITLQIWNMEDLSPTDDGVDSLPVGARFFLKNPFIKIGSIDGFPLIRVDQPFDLIRVDVPPLEGDILVVGDGDFSYSVALAKLNEKRKRQACITATSFDSKEMVCKKYSMGRSNLKILNAKPRVTVLHGIDATKLDKMFDDVKWDSVLWNFPYPAEPMGNVSGETGSKLLAPFLATAKARLKPGGLLYVTLAQGQGGTSREAAAASVAWDVETLAHNAGLEIVEVLPLDTEDLDGYKPLRSHKDERFPHQDSRIHILRVKSEKPPGESPSERTILSRLLSFGIDKATLEAPPSHIFTTIDNTIESLSPYRETSETARNLLEAARIFRDVLVLLVEETLLEEEVTNLLSKVYSTNEGFLVVTFEPELFFRAMRCSISRVAFLLRFCAKTECIKILEDVDEDFESIDIKVFPQKFAKVVRNFGDDFPWGTCPELADALLVVVALWGNLDFPAATQMADVACKMFPKDPRLHNFGASFLANLLADEGNNKNREDTKKKLAGLIQAHCRQVMKLQAEDSTEYLTAVFTLAFSLRQSITPKSADLFWGLSDDKKERIQKAISLYEKYTALADRTDRHLPAAHYHAGLLYMLSIPPDNLFSEPLEKARKHYQLGILCERDRLPFFGPVVVDSKRLLSTLVMLKSPQKQRRPQKNRGNGTSDAASSSTENVLKEHVLTREAKPKEPIGFTDSEVCTLLEELGELNISQFGKEYRGRFGKSPMLGGRKVKDALRELSKSSSAFLLSEVGRSKTVIKLTKKIEPANDSISTSGAINPSEVCELLQDQNEMCVRAFREAYKAKFGREPVSRGRGNLLKALECASKSGQFVLERRGRNESQTWIVWPDSPIVDPKKVCKLLDSRNELYFGHFRNEYKEEFGEEPPGGGRPRGVLKQALFKSAAQSGKFKMEYRKNKAELWIVLSKDRRK